MTLKIVTWNKSNKQILDLLQEIQEGKKGNLTAYTKFIAVGAFETEYSSFEEMFLEFRSIHLNGYNIG